MTRGYQMKRRAEAAEDTRRRIVRATYELHREKGIGATSVRDIAERADVSPGTVYHHYPSYGDVVVACGGYAFGIMAPPTREIFEGLETTAEKLRVLVRSVFDAYQRFPEYERVRAERGAFAEVEQAFAADEESRRSLIREAIRSGRHGKRATAVVYALLDISVYHRLVSSGMSHSAAVNEVYELLVQRFSDDRNAGNDKRKRQTRRTR